MKLNLKLKIATVLTACALFAGLGIAPIAAYAEETSVVEAVEAETSVETTENETVEETPVEAETVENNDDTVTEDVTEEENAAPVPEENETEDVKEDHSFEEFLAWTEKEAERYGYGEQYKQALEAIKTAATEKQITISTLCSLGLAAAVLCYIIYKKITDAKYKKAVAKLSAILDTQQEKINELVKGTNDNSNLEGRNGAEIELTKKDVRRVKRSLAYSTEAFMHFVEGVDMKDTKKENVLRKCSAALKEIDGEVKEDEDNEG